MKIIVPTHAGVPLEPSDKAKSLGKVKYLGGHHDFGSRARGYLGSRTNGYLVIKKDVVEFLSKSNNKILEIPFKAIEKVEIRRAIGIEAIRQNKWLPFSIFIMTIILRIVNPDLTTGLLFLGGTFSPLLLLTILMGKAVVVTYKDGAGIEQSPAFTSYPDMKVDKLKSAIYNTWHKVKEEGISEKEKQTEKASAKDDTLDQIKKLGDLKSQGLITEDEFQKKKSELLGRL